MATLPADFSLQNVKGIKESFDNAMNVTIDMFSDVPFVDMYRTDEIFEIYTSTEDLTGSKELGVLETPPSNGLQDGYSTTITESRYGNAILLPESVWRRYQNDGSTKVPVFLNREKNKLLMDLKNLLVTDLHLFLNDAFTGTTLLSPDGQPLLDTAHTWKTPGASTFDNTDTQALDSAAIDTMETYAGAFTGPGGKPQPINFDTIIVKKGSAAAREAIRLFAQQITPTAVNDINIYYGQYKIVETPYITTAIQWFAYASDAGQENACKLGIGEAPTLREPTREENEAIRINCTGFWKKGIVNMPYMWYGSTGTT